jgi:hypothetical protein
MRADNKEKIKLQNEGDLQADEKLSDEEKQNIMKVLNKKQLLLD